MRIEWSTLQGRIGPRRSRLVGSDDLVGLTLRGGTGLHAPDAPILELEVGEDRLGIRAVGEVCEAMGHTGAGALVEDAEPFDLDVLGTSDEARFQATA